jgi:hypothetical protein
MIDTAEKCSFIATIQLEEKKPFFPICHLAEQLLFGSLGFAVVDTRIWGYERAAARSYPQIRPLPTTTPKEPTFYFRK